MARKALHLYRNYRWIVYPPQPYLALSLRRRVYVSYLIRDNVLDLHIIQRSPWKSTPVYLPSRLIKYQAIPPFLCYPFPAISVKIANCTPCGFI